MKIYNYSTIKFMAENSPLTFQQFASIILQWLTERPVFLKSIARELNIKKQINANNVSIILMEKLTK